MGSSSLPPRSRPFQSFQDQQQQQQQQQAHQQQQDSQRFNNQAVATPNWAMAPKVLLVEDDDTCRQLSCRLLRIFGCAFDVAEDGLAAVGKMSQQKYDIVLMVRFMTFFFVFVLMASLFQLLMKTIVSPFF